MSVVRFDLAVKKLTGDWEFDALLDLFRKDAVRYSRQLEFCVYLADLGLLDELHNFVSQIGLYNLKALAEDPKCTYEKRGNAKILLNIYESEMIPVFERQGMAEAGVDENLLRFAQYKDNSILLNYILSNKDVLFNAEVPAKTLMYLAYSVAKVLRQQPDVGLLKLLLDSLDGFKKISAIRKAYLTKITALNLVASNNIITFPQIGHNRLQTLLGTIFSQKGKSVGAAALYELIAGMVRPELKRRVSSNKLGESSTPRVAVCISGMYRCGNLALDSVIENVVKPLNADVFFHSWTEMQEWPGLGGAGDEWLLRIFNKEIYNKCPVPLRSKKQFKEKFPRTFEIIDTPSYSIFVPERLPEELKIKKILLEDAMLIFQESNLDEERFISLGSLNQAKMLYGIYKAHELAVEYEKEAGFNYDYIIRCRPDVGLRNKLNFSDLDGLNINEVGMEFNKMVGPQDQFWYGRRMAALSMASLWKASADNNCLSPFVDFPQMRAHGLFLAWMTDNNLQPTHTPIRRDMAMATTNAVPPDFSAALAEDFKKEAFDMSQNEEVLKFFDLLHKFNKT